MASCSLTLDSRNRPSEEEWSITGLTLAVANHKELYFNYLWFSRCHGGPGRAAGERHFIHIVYTTVKAIGGVDDERFLTSYSGVPGGKTMGPMTSKRF